MPLTNLNSDVSILYILQNSEGDPSWCSLCGFEGSLPILLWARMQDCSFVSSLTTLVMHIINFMVFLVHLLFFLKHWILYFHWAKILTVDSRSQRNSCPTWVWRHHLRTKPGWSLPCGPLVELAVQGSEQMCFQCLNVLMAISKTGFINEFLWNSQKHIELFKVHVDVLLSHKNIAFILC